MLVRVLAMLHAYPPSHNAGAEWAAHGLLRDLASRGHEVDVLLSRPGGGGEPYTVDGVRVVPHRGKHDPVPWLRGDRRAQVIVTHLETTARASILGELHRIPVVHLLHNTYEKSKQWLVKGGPQLAVYNTVWMRSDAEDWWRRNRPGRPAPRGITVHPPVRAVDYRVTRGDHITLVNLTAEKGAHVFYALAERMPTRQFLGVVGGYGEQVVRHDLPNVTIVPHTPGDRMGREVYARTRVLLAPSAYESYGRVAVEAMCSGIPVIAHPTPGLRESLGEVGVFCDRADVEAWESALQRLDDPEVYRAVSAEATARADALDPRPELDVWCHTVEEVAARGRPC